MRNIESERLRKREGIGKDSDKDREGYYCTFVCILNGYEHSFNQSRITGCTGFLYYNYFFTVVISFAITLKSVKNIFM